MKRSKVNNVMGQKGHWSKISWVKKVKSKQTTGQKGQRLKRVIGHEGHRSEGQKIMGSKRSLVKKRSRVKIVMAQKVHRSKRSLVQNVIGQKGHVSKNVRDQKDHR